MSKIVPFTDKPRLTNADARAIAERVVEWLRPHCDRIAIAGSIRRDKPQVKDAEIVLIPKVSFPPFTDALVGHGGLFAPHVPPDAQRASVERALYGETQSPRWGTNYRGLLVEGIKVELFAATRQNWGYIYWLRTGPGDANQYIMQVRERVGMTWRANKGVVYSTLDDERIVVPDEATMFALMGMTYLEPHERTLDNYKAALVSPAIPKPLTSDVVPSDVADTPLWMLDVGALPELNIDYPPPLEWRQSVYQWAVASFGAMDYHAPEMYLRRRVERYAARRWAAGELDRIANERDTLNAQQNQMSSVRYQHKTEALDRQEAAIRAAQREAESVYNRSLRFIEQQAPHHKAQIDQWLHTKRGE
jgi:hypothetical protein